MTELGGLPNLQALCANAFILFARKVICKYTDNIH